MAGEALKTYALVDPKALQLLRLGTWQESGVAEVSP
jgi:hypothetical protein